MTNIDKLKVGSKGTIVKVVGNTPLNRRLSALGCIPGTLLHVTGQAPLGDPIVIQFRGTSMAIRRKDASAIYVEV